MKTLHLSTFCMALVVLGLGTRCSHEAEECENLGTCPTATATGTPTTTSASGGAAGTGGTEAGGAGEAGSPQGGAPPTSVGGATSDGGTTTSAGGVGGSGGSEPLPCDDACEGATPVCDPEANTCVECLRSKDCETGVCDPEAHECVECLESSHCNEGVCDPAGHRCVECLIDDDCEAPTPRCDEEQFCLECEAYSDCAEPTASWCDDSGSCSPCQTNDDCAHLTGTTVCDATKGECVECTGTDYASCGEFEGTPLVCDSLARTCSDQKEQSAGLCNPCVSDAECKPGQRCVQEVFDGTELGYRCFWEPGAEGAPAGCPVARPTSR